MHIDRILEDFTHTDGLPKAAIRAARVERDTVTPVFLDCLSKGAESEAELDDNDRALFFVIFLLAEFREQRAFPPLMKLLGREGERVDGILGDAITECLPQLVLSVFDGDMDPIRQLIENVEADEFVRDAMFDVLTALVLTGRLDREWIKSFLLRCYAELEPQKDSHVWIGWYQAIAALGLVELHGLVRKAYDNGFISHRYAHWHHIEGDLKEPVSDEGRDAWLEGHQGLPIEDTIEVLKSWHFARRSDPLAELGLGLSKPGSYVNKYRDVGRNDPCPCGSGKKFKKCCLAQQAA